MEKIALLHRSPKSFCAEVNMPAELADVKSLVQTQACHNLETLIDNVCNSNVEKLGHSLMQLQIKVQKNWMEQLWVEELLWPLKLT